MISRYIQKTILGGDLFGLYFEGRLLNNIRILKAKYKMHIFLICLLKYIIGNRIYLEYIFYRMA